MFKNRFDNDDDKLKELIKNNSDIFNKTVEKLYKLYFQRNFGTTMKSQIDLIMFETYLSLCKKPKNELSIDDFDMAFNLGITENKVRNLKENVIVKFESYSDDWMNSFVKVIDSAFYDEKKHLVKILISDKYTMINLRHYLEQKLLR